MTISVKNSSGTNTTISTIDDLLPVINAKGLTSFVDVTLSLDTNIYSAGEVLADTQIITNALRLNDSHGILQSIHLIDQDDQKAELKIFILSANVSLGVENSLPSITDTNAIEILGAPISILTTDYIDLGTVSISGKDGIGKVVKSATGTRNLYVAVLNGAGTPTYTSSGIKLRFGFLQD